MRVLVVFILSIFLAISASAQKVYYIYLESDDGSAFYVRMADKIYSSSTSGYLTISNLIDTTYKFTLGFPSGNNESRFIVPLNGKDRGFVVKHLEDGIGLFDMQTLSLIKAESDPSKSSVTYKTRTDEFSTLLSRASNDSTLLMVPVQVKQDIAQKEAPKQSDIAAADAKAPKENSVSTDVPGTTALDTINSKPVEQNMAQSEAAASVPKPDSAGSLKADSNALAKEDKSAKDSVADTKAIAQSPATDTTSKSNPVINTITDNTTANTAVSSVQEEFKRSKVSKHSESSTSEGFGLVYYDADGTVMDTIRLVIPNPKVSFKQDDSSALGSDQSNNQKKSDIAASPESKKKVPEVKTEAETSVTDTAKSLNMDTADIKKNTADTKEEAKAEATNIKSNSGITPARSTCRSIAKENDFFKLRRNMAARSSDDDMVDEAKRSFKNRCYTTEQIRNLSTLFLTSAGKYQFFDAAYSHVADQENFSLLKSEIKDDYYLKRFNALIGE